MHVVEVPLGLFVTVAIRTVEHHLAGATLSFLIDLPEDGVTVSGVADVTYSVIFGQFGMAALFVGVVIGIKFIAKTSMKDFILGVGGKVNRKESLTVLGFYTLGFVLSYVLVAQNIRVRSVNAGEYAVLILLMVATTWMQTTVEELIFRGVFIRWACKNEVGFTKKAMIGAAISSVLFALMHAPNPEVTTQSGIRIFIGLVNYAIPGLLMYIADLYFGSLLPGILIHWVNNFLLSTVIASEVTVIPSPTPLLDTTPHNAELVLIGTLVVYAPLMVYIILDARKKKAASAC